MKYFLQPATGMIATGKAVLIVAALLFQQVLCTTKDVDVFTNNSGNLSFLGPSGSVDKYLLKTSVSSNDNSFLLLKLPNIDTGLCLGSLIIENYMLGVNILEYPRDTCFFMFTNQFTPDLSVAHRFNCSIPYLVKNEEIFPVFIKFIDSNSDEKCGLYIKYTYLPNSEPAKTNDSCTTSCSTTPPKEGGSKQRYFNPYLAVVVVLVVLNILMATKDLGLYIRQWRRARAQKERDELPPQN